MTKKCVKCRVEAYRGSEFTFHSFPKNEKKKQMWMEALNITKPLNFNTSYVCSKHFHKKDLYYVDELRQRRRLHPEAVPDNNEDEMLLEASAERTSIPTNMSMKMQIQALDTDSDVPEKTQSPNCNHADINNDILHVKVNAYTEIPKSPNSNQLSERHVCSPIKVSMEINKRKYECLEEKMNKKIKFKSGTKIKVISREDCVSDESWLKILELLAREKSKKIAVQNQKAR